MKNPRKTSYHHGDLRRALISAALEIVREQGVGAISLREVARRAGVSHAAPAHHFGDKAGLLTAVATEGYQRLAEAMLDGQKRANESDAAKRFAWVGWAYVMFAAEHRAYFDIMFRPELLHQEDPELERVASAAHQFLVEGVRSARGPDVTPETQQLQIVLAWATVHGLATLWLNGNLPKQATTEQLDALARKLLGAE